MDDCALPESKVESSFSGKQRGMNYLEDCGSLEGGFCKYSDGIRSISPLSHIGPSKSSGHVDKFVAPPPRREYGGGAFSIANGLATTQP